MNHNAVLLLAVLLTLASRTGLSDEPNTASNLFEIRALALTEELATKIETIAKIPVDAGVLVEKMEPGGLAALAGFKQLDVITKLGSVEISGLADLQKWADDVQPGDVVRVSVFRVDESERFKLTRFRFTMPEPALPGTGVRAYDEFREPYRTDLRTTWQARVERLKMQIARYTERSKNRRERASVRQRAMEDAARAEAELAAVLKNMPVYLPPMPREFAVGAFGTYEYFIEVLQLVDETTMLARFGQHGTIWLSGFSTEGLADGKRVKLNAPIILTGTKEYTTVLGAKKTVLHVERLDLDSLKTRKPASDTE